jgi:hypothetical protein
MHPISQNILCAARPECRAVFASVSAFISHLESGKCHIITPDQYKKHQLERYHHAKLFGIIGKIATVLDARTSSIFEDFAGAHPFACQDPAEDYLSAARGQDLSSFLRSLLQREAFQRVSVDATLAA